MSYALALGADRPAPAGIMAFSGFIPTVSGWEPHLEDRSALRVFAAHGRADPVIDVTFAHRAQAQLRAGGLSVDYHELDAGHEIPAPLIAPAASWLSSTVPDRS
jgi:phospholipase/carboxylesterase